MQTGHVARPAFRDNAVFDFHPDFVRYKLAASDSGWLRHPFVLPNAFRTWLVDEASLTARLKSACPSFSVRLVRSGYLRPNHDETAPLRLRKRGRAYVREVVLRCGERDVVFAHSVVPSDSLRGVWAQVTRLGTRPLGEALFRNPRVARGEIQFRRISHRHPLMQQVRHAGLPLTARTLWARRSVFALNGHPLMVTEVFLPAILLAALPK